MTSNAEPQRDVLDELLWDPSINPAGIEVSADHGAVIVNGSIGSYTEKYTAERDVRRVRGVVSVQDDLEVRRQRGCGAYPNIVAAIRHVAERATP